MFEMLRSKTGKLAVSGHRGASGYAPENTMPAFEKALAVEIIARRLRDPVAEAEVARELRTTEVEVTVGEAQIFVADLGVEGKGKRFGAIQDR